MAIDDLNEFDLENPIGGGPIKKGTGITKGILDLNNIVLSDKDKQDSIIHVKYFPEEDRYGFSIYNRKK